MMIGRRRRHQEEWLRTRRTELSQALMDAGVWRELPADEAVSQMQAVSEGEYPLVLPFLERMSFIADGEDLAEGMVEDLLREMTPTLEQFGVRLRVRTGNRPDNSDEEYSVVLNDRICVVLEAGRTSHDADWFLATMRPLAAVNALLAETGTRARVFVLRPGTNDGTALILDPGVVTAMERSGIYCSNDIPHLATDRFLP